MSLNPKLQDWQGRSVWLVGASSGIGLALAETLHARGARVALSARSAHKLQAFVDRHPGSLALPLDVSDAPGMAAAARDLQQQWGGLDFSLYSAGHYQAMRAADFDLQQARQHFEVNFGGALNWLAATLPLVQAQAARGAPAHLSFISSVAGYRGLPKSLAYGPSKAALSNLAEALYLDLHGQGIGVSLVCPGFVQTPLTAQNDFRMPALITPQQAAQSMVEGYARGDFEIHFPKRFTLWLKLMRILPHRLYFNAVKRVTGV